MTMQASAMAPPRVDLTCSTTPTSTNPTEAIKKTCYILELVPAELRNHIYSYAVTACNPARVITNHILPRRDLPVTFHLEVPALFATCKQIREESRELFIYENTFQLPVSVWMGLTLRQRDWLKSIGKKRAARLEKIEVSFDQEWVLGDDREQWLAQFCLGKLEHFDYEDLFASDRRTKEMQSDVLKRFGPTRTAAREIVEDLVEEGGFRLDQIKIVRPLPSKWDMLDFFAETIFVAWKEEMAVAISDYRQAYQGIRTGI